jgi:hypothetical protein
MASKPKSPRPLWFVSPVIVDEDQNKPQIFPERGQAEIGEDDVAPQPARARNAQPPQPQPATVGYGFTMGRTQKVEIAFTTKNAAIEYAKQQASKTPTIAYGVYGCVDVFETTAPTVIEKQFNEGGELVLKSVEKVENAIVEQTV